MTDEAFNQWLKVLPKYMRDTEGGRAALRRFAALVAEGCAKLVEEAHAEDYSAPAGARAIREKFEIKG